ncbi:MAG: PH domain-containing protein [Methanospirillaceae archaeon]|nr:PH domain-containing protein [Methanospirillaceae archaeon]
MTDIVLNAGFKPEPVFRIYLFASIVVLFIVLTVFFLPLGYAITEDMIGVYGAALFLSVLFLLSCIWVPFYYASVLYILTDNEMNWARGVLWKQTGIVPYNRITNVDIVQGPLMRIFHLSNLRIQTAGYSGNQMAEIRIQGILEPKPLRDCIMRFVHAGSPVAATTGTDMNPLQKQSRESDEMITELIAIRTLLERIEKKL